MAFYKVEVKKSALKEIEKLNRGIVGQITNKIVTVYAAGHRKDVYR